MHITDLTAEQKAQAWTCKTPEDLLALIRESGYDLSDAELEAMPYGAEGSWSQCNQDTNSGPY